MLKAQTICLALAGFMLATALPVEDTSVPFLKELPAEIQFWTDGVLQLPCDTEGDKPDVKYTWHKDGKPFDWKAIGYITQHRPNAGTLFFSKTHPNDEGIYQCFAESSYGIASTRPVYVRLAYINAPTVKPEEHNPTEGLPYKLDCNIPNSYPVPEIVWKTQHKSDPKKIETVLSRRLTISPEGTLWFSNVTKEDVNPDVKYLCMTKGYADKEVVLAEHVMKTLVQNKQPKNGELTLQYVSKDMVGQVGNVTMIYCIYGGTPLAFPNWYKDGKLINAKGSDRVTDHNRTSGKRLLIKDTFLEDAGTYTCEVDNHVGKKQTHSIKLTVISAPRLTKKTELKLNFKEGQDIVISCPITAKPEPKITWTLNAKPLGDRGTYKDGLLTVKGAKKADSGYYGCKAENEYGSYYSEVLAIVA